MCDSAALTPVCAWVHLCIAVFQWKVSSSLRLPLLYCPCAAWIQRCTDAGQAPASPLTNLRLGDVVLLPNLLARSLINTLTVEGCCHESAVGESTV